VGIDKPGSWAVNIKCPSVLNFLQFGVQLSAGSIMTSGGHLENKGMSWRWYTKS
jgi:hypothetical protein